MEKLIEFFCFLILAFLSVVAPIFVILLSIFREGMEQLSSRYEHERNHSEKNIIAQVQVKESSQGINVDDIEISLKQLKANKKSAEKRLAGLDPKKQVKKVIAPFLIAFVVVLISFLFKTYVSKISLLCVGAIGFAYGLFSLWHLLEVIIEVRKVIDDQSKEVKTNARELAAKNIELLSSLSLAVLELKNAFDGQDGKESKAEQLLKSLVEAESKHFLKDVYLSIGDQKIKDESIKIDLLVNKKTELKVVFINSELRMTKKLEVGFIFPSDFLIEKSTGYSIYTDESIQIVRYETSSVQGHTSQVFSSPLIITPLKKTSAKIKTFIKAENIEAVYKDITIDVTDA
jgi:hypothetical protein